MCDLYFWPVHILNKSDDGDNNSNNNSSNNYNNYNNNNNNKYNNNQAMVRPLNHM